MALLTLPVLPFHQISRELYLPKPFSKVRYFRDENKTRSGFSVLLNWAVCGQPSLKNTGTFHFLSAWYFWEVVVGVHRPALCKSLVWIRKVVVSRIEGKAMWLLVFCYGYRDFPCHCRSFNPSSSTLSPFYKQLLDEAFVISRIIKDEVSIISRAEGRGW